MNPTTLLADCAAAGIRLSLTGDGNLAVDAPVGTVSPDLVSRLRACKTELVGLLTNDLAGPVATAGSYRNRQAKQRTEEARLPCRDDVAGSKTPASPTLTPGNPPFKSRSAYSLAGASLSADGLAAKIGIENAYDDAGEPATPGRTCRCGCRETTPIAIHDGRSTRLDCARCGRFVDFGRWYGRDREAAKATGRKPRPGAKSSKLKCLSNH